MASPAVHVGVDVGGTNTDAAVLKEDRVVGWAKQVTTADVTSGVARAIQIALENACQHLNTECLQITRVHIGTTHFVNALVQMKHLAKVSVIRLCGPATVDLEPFIDFPEDLKQYIGGRTFMLDGGHEFDGENEIRPVNEEEILHAISILKSENLRNISVCGIFSPVNSAHEEQVRDIIAANYPEASVTLSHEIGQIGLLERENAAILNESLKPLCAKTVAAFRTALDRIGLTCPFYLTQNDGTLISAEETLAQPVNTFASGPTNSMRGAAFLSGLKEAVVADIGGTTTDIGILIGGFPKEASFKVKVGNVRTNFRMPDVMSIGLGGGSKVLYKDSSDRLQIKVGPESVGYRLEKEAVVFGGQTLTASDLAVAGGLVEMGDPNLLSQNKFTCNEDSVMAGITRIREIVEETIDQVKTSKDEVPVILVGGGSVLIDSTIPLKGTSRVYKPPNFQVANAVGAALSQVSGSVDHTFDLFKITRDKAIEHAKNRAIQYAVKAGAREDTVQVTDVMEVPMAYLPSNATRVKVRAVGDLLLTESSSDVAMWTRSNAPNINDEVASAVQGVPQLTSATGRSLTEDLDIDISAEEKDPTIDHVTGEWLLSEWDVECIAAGAGILGCGGGGSPYLGKLMTLKRLKEGKKIRVITPERYRTHVAGDDDLAVPVFIMGAITIFNERTSCYPEVLTIVKCLNDLYDIGGIEDGDLKNTEGVEIVKGEGITYIDDYQPKPPSQLIERKGKVAGLLTIECGGSNCMVPMYTAPFLDLPVIDADCMGRAFPELQHNTSTIYGHSPYPTCLSYYNHRRAVILHADTPLAWETHFRNVCIDMGCAGGTLSPPLNRDEIWNPENGGKVIRHSLSRAWRLGKAVWTARKAKTSPIDAILQHEGGKLLFWGKVTDVLRRTVKGFARGDLTLEGFHTSTNRTMLIHFQNENLVAKLQQEGGSYQVVACVPDLITLVDHELGEPVPTEEVRYGLRVAVLALPAPPLLRTPEALAYVGPQAFGYPEGEVKFEPIGDFVPHDPVPPK